MKLNKRLQALENKHSDLTQKNQIITQEHHSILEFLKSLINDKLILENEQNKNNIDFIKIKLIEYHQEEKNKIVKQTAIIELIVFIDINFSGEKISMRRKGIAVIRITMDTFPPKVSLLWH